MPSNPRRTSDMAPFVPDLFRACVAGATFARLAFVKLVMRNIVYFNYCVERCALRPAFGLAFLCASVCHTAIALV